MVSRSASKPGIAFVLPAWQEAAPLPLYWAQILEALEGLDVDTEVIIAEVYPLINRAQPPPERRASALRRHLCVPFSVRPPRRSCALSTASRQLSVFSRRQAQTIRPFPLVREST